MKLIRVKVNVFSNKKFLCDFSQGLLASKAVGVDGAEKKEDYSETAPMLEQVWNGSVWFFSRFPTGMIAEL